MPQLYSILSKAAAVFLATTCAPASAHFLSVDPAPANPSTGENFNRYWYGNNNPYMFTDPDGRTVRFGGNTLYQTQAQAQWAGATAADPELARRAQVLIDSPHDHYIGPVSQMPEDARDPAKPNRAVTFQSSGPEANATNHVGASTETYYNPNATLGPGGSDQSSPTNGQGTPTGTLIHEVLSHAYDIDQGTNDRSINPATGYPRPEERADALEKVYVERVKKTENDKAKSD